MRTFSFKPAVTLRGREFRGLRGFAGKPFHPPLTDVTIGAYVLAAAFDVISFAWSGSEWSRDFYRAASFALIAGLFSSVGTALTGFWEWWKSTEKGTQARRTTNAHAWVMLAATGVVIADIAIRWFTQWDAGSTPLVPMVLSLVVFALISLGGTIGGSLTYDYGFSVENSSDHPVWHRSEEDVYPGQTKD